MTWPTSVLPQGPLTWPAVNTRFSRKPTLSHNHSDSSLSMPRYAYLVGGFKHVYCFPNIWDAAGWQNIVGMAQNQQPEWCDGSHGWIEKGITLFEIMLLGYWNMINVNLKYPVLDTAHGVNDAALDQTIFSQVRWSAHTFNSSSTLRYGNWFATKLKKTKILVLPTSSVVKSFTWGTAWLCQPLIKLDMQGWL